MVLLLRRFTSTDIESDFLERDVKAIYIREGSRSYDNGAKILSPSIAIVVDGYENGYI